MNDEDVKTSEKKSVIEKAVDVVTEHPIATIALVSIGCGYLYFKLEQHAIYQAVLKANIDAYNQTY